MADELIVNKVFDDVLEELKGQIWDLTSQLNELIDGAYYERDPDLTFNKKYIEVLEGAHTGLDKCLDVRKYSIIDASRLKDEIIISFLSNIGLEDLAEKVRKLCQ